ncbi:MAG: LruC domain-containing protein [Bacteroidales bacterium]
MKKNVLVAYASFLCTTLFCASMLFTGCSNNPTVVEPEPPTPEPVPTYFEFATTKDYTLKLNLSTDNLNPGITKFDVFIENPFELIDEQTVRNHKVTAVMTGLTNTNGAFEDQLRIPAYVKSIYIMPYKVGLPEVLNEEITSSIITLNLKDILTTKNTFIYNTIKATNTFGFSPWDANGKPQSVYKRDIISASLLNDINTTLPNSPLPDNHPEFFNNNAVHQLVLVDSCEIDLVFVHEGAGWLNTLGYYYYPTNNPPANLNNTRKYVAFPNSSFSGSGGGLTSGDRVKLQYWDGTKFKTTFPAGITVGWFIYANGFKSTDKTVNIGNYMHTSNPSYNLESNPNLKQHSVLLKDPTRSLLVISFEDIKRDLSYCDQDFNDAIFYALPNPFTAVQANNIPSLSVFVDTDGDGVSDELDEFPNDPTIAYTSHYPGKNTFATLAYEDLWPSQGDYDMNDLVCDYNMIHYNNSSNKISKASGTIRVRASGAKFKNGFAIELGVSPASINTLTIQNGSLTSNVLQLDGKGLETGQNKANIPLFDDVYKLFNKPNASFINTEIEKDQVTYKDINYSMTFSSPQTLSSLGIPPYNPYMIIDCGAGNRGKEVHLPSYKPTNKADTKLFSTADDLTNPSQNRYYVNSTNMPFALHVAESFVYPVEKANIKDSYNFFNSWANSYGSSYPDWYKPKNGYFDFYKLYIK